MFSKMISRIGILVAVTVPVAMLGGCSKGTPPTPENMQSFAPGPGALSPEAQAAKEKNERDLRERQAKAGNPAR